jgi:hypothetical protein
MNWLLMCTIEVVLNANKTGIFLTMLNSTRKPAASTAIVQRLRPGRSRYPESGSKMSGMHVSKEVGYARNGRRRGNLIPTVEVATLRRPCRKNIRPAILGVGELQALCPSFGPWLLIFVPGS